MLQDFLTDRKALFASGAHTELRGQLNRNRRVILLSGSIVANTRSDISGLHSMITRISPRRSDAIPISRFTGCSRHSLRAISRAMPQPLQGKRQKPVP